MSDQAPLRKTPLYDQHSRAGAKTGPFAGYDMPLYYKEGVIKEHEWVRSQAGIFDVSHMGQITLEGPGVVPFLEKITPSAYGQMQAGRARYTVLTNDQGGIVDDLIVTRLDESRFYAVINAGGKDKDIAWIEQHLPDDITLTRMEDRALIALQGPASEQVLRDIFHIDTEGMPFMWLLESQLGDGTKIYVSRVGYTGEDGFELSIPASAAEGAWVNLNTHGAVMPAGLAARDSLRLEMGYCLYGHDIDDRTTPVEAGLGWVIGKDNTGFIGAGAILPQRDSGADKKRVGIRLLGKGIAREGAEIRNDNDEAVGVITSGGFSPSLRQAIGQGYVGSAYAEAGTKLFVNVRGRNIEAEVAAMPFLPAKTKSMKQQAA